MLQLVLMKAGGPGIHWDGDRCREWLYARCVPFCIFSHMAADNTKLSSTVSVARYRELEQYDDRQALAQFVRDRFNQRYFRPIESTSSADKHGFTIMAVCCLVIEALESFYQGKADTKGHSKEMFDAFFKRDTPFKVFGGGGDWFYKDIRCGILHQSEARGGWRILRSGPLLDVPAKSINATRCIRELCKAVDTYANQIQHDDALWALFKKKMKAVCDNCG
jgi:hypothetical protein